MRISDWSSDVCSSDLFPGQEIAQLAREAAADDRQARAHRRSRRLVEEGDRFFRNIGAVAEEIDRHAPVRRIGAFGRAVGAQRLLHARRSEEHTSELQSLMRISYAVFCLTNNNNNTHIPPQ